MQQIDMTTVIIAALAAPGFWEIIKMMISLANETLTGKKKASLDEIGEKLDIQGKKIDSLERSFARKEVEDEEKEAKAARRRILRADDEIRTKVKHSKDFFEDILRDIDYYENYCDTHPHFKNKCAESAIRNVSETYDQCKAENSFL